MTGLLEGKVALITGSGRGQGLAAAKLFASEKCTVVVNDLDEDVVKAAVDEIIDSGGAAVAGHGDVSDAFAVREIVERATVDLGGLDILYNNAGIGFSAKARMGVEMTDVVHCTEEDWRRIIDINLGGVFLVCKYGIPALLARGGGSVINTASIGALRGGPSAHAYIASKGAVVSLTRSIARTWAPKGIRANTICPGVIDTDMIHDTMLASEQYRDAIAASIPVGRIGTVDDIARTALFLATDAASFINGQAICVDGGATA